MKCFDPICYQFTFYMLAGKDEIWNPRVYKAQKEQLADVLEELRRIEVGGKVDDELLDVIRMIAMIMDGMKSEK